MKHSFRVVFVGNPNCGKTTLFNVLAGTNLKTANYPGVTVEKRSADFTYDHIPFCLIDLPGLYRLDHTSAEEKIACDVLMQKQYDLIVNVIDATNLSRSLYLTYQLFSLGKPIIIALNMMDAADAQGIAIDIAHLQKLLALPILPVSAKKKNGLEVLRNALKSPPTAQTKHKKADFSTIDTIVAQCVHMPSKRHTLTQRLDRVCLHPVWGTILFFCVMAGIFFLTFRLGDIGKTLMQNSLSRLCIFLDNYLKGIQVKPAARSLLIDGVLGGVGSILSFLPNLLILFTLLALLGDSGYMARIAYLTDGVMHRLHLNGKASIALILALGCSVPAICATRTIDHRDDRIRTILITPFISCSARLPIYVLFAGTFFPQRQTLVIILLYLLGICTALIWAKLLSEKEKNNDGSRLLLELPSYHMPTLGNLLIDVWGKIRDYLTRAATIVLVASVLLWFATHQSTQGYTTDVAQSFAARLGKLLVPLLRPAGLGFWQIAIALIAGIWAKEIVVSYTGILFSLPQSTLASAAFAQAGFHAEHALSMMVFCLLYVPCIATLAAIFRETHSLRLTVKSLFLQLFTAYLAAFAVYQIALIV